MYTVFIDGQEGTTGLQIRDRLTGRSDINLIEIPGEKRKDPETKKQFLNRADCVILCLPDGAARESVAMIENSRTNVIDASTAHRTDPDWVYGLPELTSDQRDHIRNASRVSNPGCYATGFVLLVRPLVDEGIISPEYPVTCSSVSGYSGAGKKLIAQYEGPPEESAARLGSRYYALTLQHKHLPEMRKYGLLKKPPLFLPIVCAYYCGMTAVIPLHRELLRTAVSPEQLHGIYTSRYGGEPFLTVNPLDVNESLDDGFLNPVNCNGTNRCDIFVFGNDEQMVVASRFDNLGKGASGAAVQNLNIMMGVEETTGL